MDCILWNINQQESSTVIFFRSRIQFFSLKSLELVLNFLRAVDVMYDRQGEYCQCCIKLDTALKGSTGEF